MDAVVELEGEIDVEVSDGVRETLLRAVDGAGGAPLVIDMSRVTFLDSSGLSALIAALKATRQQDGALRVANVSDAVRTLFDVTGLASPFGIDDDPA